MRVSLEWLSEYVDLEVGVEELAGLLTNSGTEVEGIETVGEELAGLLVGKVSSVGSHPNADRLYLCVVEAGGKRYEVVCGAPNAEPGIAVPFAPPGSILPDGTLIEEVDIRGVTSQGMLLSGRELGISDDAEGLMLLDGAEAAGGSLMEALGLPDTILILEITPNRPDCLSMVGIAREVAALTGQELRTPSVDLREVDKRTADAVEIEIRDADLCSRYTARVIEGLEIRESPWWMQRRLRAAGTRPISNIVDITNYVMLELGQPLHAFDYAKVEDGRIIVRRATGEDELTTLDGVERKFRRDSLLICDPSGSIALAGVMGGERTEISEGTSRVLLESAHFDPPSIMRTSRYQELSSEASYRFERGVDPNGCVLAADRASALMQKLASGGVLQGAVDVVGRGIDPVRLELRVRRAGKLIGIPLEKDRAADLMRSIHLDVCGARKEGEEEILEVEVPTFRPDLEREVDLVEEVARLYGYRDITPTLPRTSHNIGGLTTEQRMRRKIKRVMNGLGLYEAITYPFIDPHLIRILDPRGGFLVHDTLRLRNPIGEEASAMRPTLIPGLLDILRFNINRRNMDVFIFEIGRVFIPRRGEKLPHEPMRLGCVLMGRWIPEQWDREPEEVDFYTVKGVIEGLCSSLHIDGMSLRRAELSFLHPSQSCIVSCGGEDWGFMGLIHPRVAEEMTLPLNTAVMEIGMGELLDAVPERLMYKEIPRFPAVQVDIAVVVNDEVDSIEIERLIRKAGGKLLREVRLFDQYRGEQLGEGEKSLAYSLTFNAMDRTLTDEEARSSYDNIVEVLEENLGARLRS
ncbi:MAG: phenylalanine--tRNA ligase subunit beta [Actinomycetota bacterium]